MAARHMGYNPAKEGNFMRGIAKAGKVAGAFGNIIMVGMSVVGIVNNVIELINDHKNPNPAPNPVKEEIPEVSQTAEDKPDEPPVIIEEKE